jgi:hypothetical protein
MDVTALEMLMTDGVGYADFVSALFDRYGESRGKRIVGDKTPRYVLSLPTLSRLWPTAKFVHLIRDGRDVSLSVLDWRKGPRKFPTWQSDPISTLGLWWEWHVRLGREAGASLGDERYYELRYEALVADPERECQPLCDFLGLDYEPEMLRFHEGRTKSKPGLSAKKAWLPVTLGVRDWRAQMSTDDLSRFQAAAGDLLDELGYERPPVDVLEDQQARAARTRDAFEGHARAAGWRVPGAWENVPA